MNMRKNWLAYYPLLLISIFSCMGSALNAQKNDTLLLDAPTLPIHLGGSFSITFTFEDYESLLKSERGQLDLPDLPDFDILSGPNLSMQTTVINGRSTQKQIFHYLLKPKAIGVFEIPTAYFTISDQTYTSAPHTIKVL